MVLPASVRGWVWSRVRINGWALWANSLAHDFPLRFPFPFWLRTVVQSLHPTSLWFEGVILPGCHVHFAAMPRLCTLRVTSASDSALLEGQTLWQAQGFGHFCIRVARSAFREHCYHSGRQAWGNIRRQEIILCGRWTWVMFWRAETTRFFEIFWGCRPFEIR